MFVSVIIPVYNHSDFLKLCLDALSKQTLQRDQFEVIVIDNGSDEPPEQLVANYDFTRYTTESKPGSFAARNHGLTLAKGDYIAFTDSDCRPAPDWLEIATDELDSSTRTDVVAGRINVVADNAKRPNSVELFDIAIRLNQESRVAKSNGVVTANMVTRRDLFDQVGKFDDSLMSGADAEWSQRAASQGYSVRYIDEAIVSHPTRTTLRELLTQTRRRAGGRFDMQANVKGRSPMSRIRIAATKILPRWKGLGEARRRLAKRDYGLIAWLRVVAVMQIVHYAAFFEMVRRLCGNEAERR